MAKKDEVELQKQLKVVINNIRKISVTMAKMNKQLDEISAYSKIGAKDYLRLNEACIYLGVSKSFLYDLIESDKIEHTKKGNKLTYFKKSDLDKWMTQSITRSRNKQNKKR